MALPRARAAESVSISSSPTEALLRALEREQSRETRIELIQALNQGERRGEQSFRAAAEAMSGDLDPTVREAAALAVLSYPGAQTLRLAEKLLNEEPGAKVREGVCAGLGRSEALKPFPEVVDILARVLAEDKSVEVRGAALRAIDDLDGRRALSTLRRVAKSERDPKLRRRVQTVLQRLSVAPRLEPKKRKKTAQVSPEAVKGSDACENGNGWCECSMGPLQPKPRCIPQEDCVYLYENSYARFGYRCTWDGGSLD